MIYKVFVFIFSLIYSAAYCIDCSDCFGNEREEKISILKSSSEAFLVTDRVNLRQKRSGELYCTDQELDNIFPPCNQHNVNPSVGRIYLDDTSTGTGTIINIEGDRVTGITAKHVFLGEGCCYNNKMVYGNFYPGSVRMDDNSTNWLAEIRIDEIITDGTCKDIAVFKGNLLGVPQEVKDLLISKVSKIRAYNEPIRGGNVKIYQYPLGYEDQRIKEGKILPGKYHYVSTLPGSSGAPIFQGDEIIAIHIAGADAITKVRYFGDKLKDIKGERFDLSENNVFEMISNEDLRYFDNVLIDNPSFLLNCCIVV